MKYVFPKESRLLKKSDFQYLRQESSKLSSRFFICFYKKSQLNQKKTRLGISVSKKVGNAVLRNKIKRLTREFFRTSSFKELGLDILIVCKRGIADFEDNRELIRDDLEKLFKKLNL